MRAAKPFESPTQAESETVLMHDALLLAAGLLAIGAERPIVPISRLRELRDFVVAQVRHHHESEDNVLWPLLVAADPVAGAPLSALTLEHEIFETALDSLAMAPLSVAGDRSRFAERARRVREALEAHFGDEEPMLLPLMRRLVTADEWRGFVRRLVWTSPHMGGVLLAALVCRVATASARAAFIRNLPAPLRVLLPLQRRRADATLRLFADAVVLHDGRIASLRA